MRFESFTPTADGAKLEQVLRLVETLLLDGTRDDVCGRICQVAAHTIGAAAVAIVNAGEAPPRILARYGAEDAIAAVGDVLAQSVDEGRPTAWCAADGSATLTLPLGTDAGGAALYLVNGNAAPFTADQVALARYVAALASVALRQAARRTSLARAVDTRSDVLLALGHDLRTPLSAVIGYAQLLRDDDFGPCTDEQRGVLGNIEQQALQLLTLLNQALELARADVIGDTASHDEFALDEVLRELCTSAAARHNGNGNGVRVAWSVDPALPPVHGDRFRVRQIVQNLLDNALRFTDAGHVTVDALPHNGGVRLVVSDTGAGIARADLPYLFEPFRPGGSVRSGTGCGLYLVKRFSENLGGQIGVDSTPGIGTRFTVDLPLR